MDAAWAQVIVSIVQTGVLIWGLWQMQIASSQRNRQLDQQDDMLKELLKRST